MHVVYGVASSRAMKLIEVGLPGYRMVVTTDFDVESAKETRDPGSAPNPRDLGTRFARRIRTQTNSVNQLAACDFENGLQASRILRSCSQQKTGVVVKLLPFFFRHASFGLASGSFMLRDPLLRQEFLPDALPHFEDMAIIEIDPASFK